jgi:glycosyltransferase involved in cell wall biosynthesis
VVRLLRIGLRQESDCYHFHDPELLPVGLGLRLLGKRVIYDVHEHFPQVAMVRAWVPARLRRPLSWLVDAAERWAARWLSGVVGVVEAQERRFEGRPFAAVKNVPRLDWFRVDERDVADFELLHVGSLSPERGGLVLPEIVRALQGTHPGARLLCIGRFHTAQMEAGFRRRVREYGLEELVHCRTEPVPHDELGGWIRRGRVGLIPGQVSVQNMTPFVPTKLFEYLACGLPVVAGDLPSIRRFHAVADWGVLVEPSDADGYARAAGYLLDHAQMARELGQQGREVVERCFNWETEARKLLDLYARVLA